MGGSSSQVVGYRYYAKFAAFIGNRIEEFLAINFDNRGWIVHDPTNHPVNMLPVHEGNLFGENEGGVSGNINIHFGTPDQEPDEVYQQYLPLVSGYPYQSYLLFHGITSVNQLTGAQTTAPGFYLGNSGYMKEMLLWVKRIYVKNSGDEQWYSEKAGIGANLIPYELTLIPYVTSDVEISVNQELLGTTGLNGVSDHTINYSANLDTVIDSSSIRAIYTIRGDDSVIQTANFKTKYDFTAITGLFIGRVRSLARCKNHELSITSNRFIGILNRSSGVVTLQNSSNEYEDFNYIELEFVCGGGGYITVETTASGSVDRGGFFGGEILRLDSGSFLLEKFTGKYKGSTDAIDINPIHKIREILTDDTAMAKPEADVNDINFMKAADRIWDEGLGVSWAIDEKSCIDAIEELCYHIEAGVRVNRQTGLYEMVLFRDDWFSEDEIHTITENKIKDLSLEVMNSDDIVNQLNVTYYDRERIKNSTFSVYENGSILTMGKANAESVEFPYFMYMRNAEIVANWKLKQYSTPAWKGTFTTGWREARKWNRYDLVKINWSKKWQGTILARIMKIDLGNGLNNEVMIDFEEVVPYSGEMNTSIVVDAPAESAPQPPQPSMNEVFEAPYYLTVLRAGQTNADLELSNNPDIGYVAAIAAKPQSNSLNALLYTDGGIGEFEQVSRLDYCDILQLDQPISETMSAFVVTGTLTQTANSNNLILLNDEFMGFVSFDDETKVLTVKRGVLDTVPKKHTSGSLFVFDLPDVAFDSTQYTQSEVVESQVLTTTPSGIQELSEIGTAVEIQSRAIRPYPPANVKINGEYWPTEIESNLVLTWVDRNRTQQTGGEILGWFDAGVTLESGVTYNAEVYDAQSNIKFAEQLALTSNTATFEKTELSPLLARVDLYSLRDGFESHQKYQHIFSWGQPPESFITAFTSNGAFTVPAGVTDVDVLIVAGGGGGGSRQGGGGGGGGVIVLPNYSVTPGDSIPVVVGAGGAGGVNGDRGSNGQNSSFGSIVANGGGGGGGRSSNNDGSAGGSGGGGGGIASSVGNSSGGNSIPGQGNSGGKGILNVGVAGGGGGGASASGLDATSTSTETTPGNGGEGLFLEKLTSYGDAGYFAGGGGGAKNGTGSDYTVGGQGGRGGGGRAGYPLNTTTSAALPQNGSANTGGGGGASFLATEDGGSGGSGIVIIVYPAGQLEPTIMAKRAITVAL
ncbi:MULTISPECIES: glycine-rich domain-containing protein [unclassified Acinetobacter]|uniref:glycine-rich domain-containing protein n=1 Tax=unclassified Acinetobacter TaxID=196816 RepID=UPI0015D1EB2E|nr:MULTISPECIES: phage tail protein [unclassified Acinetobacter]